MLWVMVAITPMFTICVSCELLRGGESDQVRSLTNYTIGQSAHDTQKTDIHPSIHQ
jgi:hypothetical protein